jgi:hypothetical protein
MVMSGMGHDEREPALADAVIGIKSRPIEIPATRKRMGILDTDWSRFSTYSACIGAHTEQAGAVGCLSPPGRIVLARELFTT